MWQSECSVNILFLYIFCPELFRVLSIFKQCDNCRVLGWRGPGGPQGRSGGLPSPPPSTFHLLPTQTRKATSGQISSKVVSPLGPFVLLWNIITKMSWLQRWLRTSTAFFLLEISSSSAIGTGIRQISFSSKTEIKVFWFAKVLKGKKKSKLYYSLSLNGFLYNLVISSVS